MNKEICNSQEERIDYTFHAAVVPCQKGRLVLIGHGVTGNKDRPWAVALAESCAAAGIDALRFSFSGNGDSGGEFADSNITKEVADLGVVLDAVSSGYSDIIYVGHSMGAAVGVLRAAEDSRITHLISLAGMVHTKRFAETEFGEETPDSGVMWEDEDCPLSSAFVDDLSGIDSVLGLAGKIEVPWLLVHGSEDDVVPVGESREMLDKANSARQFVEIPGADHVFSSDEACRTMTQAVMGFLV